MQRRLNLRSLALGLACLGMAIPKTCLGAAPVVSAAPAITDVGLQAGGVLRGQLLDGQGHPRPGAVVTINWQNRVIAAATTDRQGEFSVAGLRGGIHTVTSGPDVAPCRFWALSTSPPNVPHNLLVVSNPTTVRGNNCRRHAMANMLSNPYFLGLAVGAAIIIPVAINASNDDDSGS